MKKNTLLEYLKDNTDTLRELVNEANSYDGSLEDYVYYENDEYFFNEFFNNAVDDAVRAICYGDYNYMDDYVKFNAYGNLESCGEYELNEIIIDNVEEIFDTFIELYKTNKVDIWDKDFKILVNEYLEGMDKNGK